MMKISIKKINEWALGVFGGVLLGIISFLWGVSHGGNNRCWPLNYGYETCGEISGLLGILIGVVIGVYSSKWLQHKFSRHFSINLLAIALFGPTFIGIMASSSHWEWELPLAILTVTGFFFVSSAVISAILIAIKFKKVG